MATAKRVVTKIISPIEEFLKLETASGIVLMFVTAIALTWANSPFYESYEHFIEMPLGFMFGSFQMEKTLHHWVNDGLMVIFFFVVGLEIKRELAEGELSTPRRAALPMFAALGGMVIPALIYVFFNHDGIGHSGWGIPMATDIAFAVGVLALMSKRVPFSLKIFLLALAIVDDLGAVLVIAFFYTDHISTSYLGYAALTFILTFFFKTAGVRNILTYTVLGVFAWFFVFKSGIHATIAGVVLGLMTPVAALYEKIDLPKKLKEFADSITADIKTDEEGFKGLSHSAEMQIHSLRHYTSETVSPLDRLIHTLHPWVSFVIMPLFALVNAGVRIEGLSLTQLFSNDIAIGVILGLFLGKPIGVILFSFMAVKFNLCRLPRGVTWAQIASVGCLAGIGFTMALFVSHLALKVPEVEVYSKLGILTASVLSGIVGSAILFVTSKPETK